MTPSLPRRPRTREVSVVTGALVLAGAIALAGSWPVQLARATVGVARNAVTSRDLDRVQRDEIILVAGVDDRRVVSDDLGAFGAFQGRHADVLFLVRAAPGGLKAVSLPRDLRAHVTGYGTQRLGAFREYGAPALVRAVRSVVAVPIAHYIEIDMDGFAALVDAVGGIDVRFTRTAREGRTGFEASKGVVRLDGKAALAFVRSRRYIERRGDTWVRIDIDDRRRVLRLHRAVTALNLRASELGVAGMIDMLIASRGHVSLDVTMDLQDAVPLARRLAGGRWELSTLPTRRLVPRGEALSPFPPARWGAGATLVPLPGAVDQVVSQLNGSTGPGL